MRLTVIDISHYQTVSDVAAIRAAGVLGVIAKATEGTGYTDDKFATNRKVFAGFGWASYHFLKPGSIAAQMQHYMAVATPAKGERVVIDYEDNGCSLTDLQEAVNWLRAHAPDNPICIYGGGLMKGQISTALVPWLAGTDLWIAEYTSAPEPIWPTQVWPAWTLWQYSDGSVGGHPRVVLGISQCDCSAFNGTDSECLAWFGGKEIVPTPQPIDTPAPAVARTLRIGMTGDDVRTMQAELSMAGIALAADGAFGPITDRAVKAFQAAHGLVQDGICGPLTMAALKAAS